MPRYLVRAIIHAVMGPSPSIFRVHSSKRGSKCKGFAIVTFLISSISLSGSYQLSVLRITDRAKIYVSSKSDGVIASMHYCRVIFRSWYCRGSSYIISYTSLVFSASGLLRYAILVTCFVKESASQSLNNDFSIASILPLSLTGYFSYFISYLLSSFLPQPNFPFSACCASRFFLAYFSASSLLSRSYRACSSFFISCLCFALSISFYAIPL